MNWAQSDMFLDAASELLKDGSGGSQDPRRGTEPISRAEDNAKTGNGFRTIKV